MHKAPAIFAVFPLVCLLYGGCQKGPAVRPKVLIGATTIVSAGAQPIVDSVVIVAGTKIRAVGERKDVPVPDGSRV